MVQRQAVFQREPLDVPERNPAGFDLRAQQKFEHPPGLADEQGADAVAGHDADHRPLGAGEVPGRAPRLHALRPGELFVDKGAELFHGAINVRHLRFISFV